MKISLNQSQVNNIFSSSTEPSQEEKDELTKKYNLPSGKATIADVGKEFLKTLWNIPQTMAREAGSIGVEALKNTGGPSELQFEPENTVTGKVQRFVFGTPQESTSLGGIKAEAQKSGIKETLESIGVKPGTAQTLTIPLFVLSAGLDWTPFGTETRAVGTIAKSKSATEISSILKKVNVADDLIPTASKDLAQIGKISDVKKYIDNLAEIQGKTKYAGEQTTIKSVPTKVVDASGNLVDKAETKGISLSKNLSKNAPEGLVEKTPKVTTSEKLKGFTPTSSYNLGYKISTQESKTASNIERFNQIMKEEGRKENYVSSIESLKSSFKSKISELSQKSKDISSLKKDAIKIAKQTFPSGFARFKIVNKIDSIKTSKGFSSAVDSIVKESDKMWKSRFVEDITKLLKGSDNLGWKEKDAVVDMFSKIKVGGESKSTINKLLGLEGAVKKEPLIKQELGRSGQSLFNRIQNLSKEDIKKMSAQEVKDIRDKLADIVSGGLAKNKIKSNIENLKTERSLDELASSSKVIDDKAIDEIGKIPQKQTSFIHGTAENLKKGYVNGASVDNVTELADGLKDGGPNYRLIKKPIDYASDTAQVYTNEGVAKITSFLNASKKKFGKMLKKENFERIGLYGLRNQSGGKRIIQDADKSGRLLRNADSIKLSEQEKEFYDMARNTYESLYEPVNKAMREVYNESIGKVEGYWPVNIDYSDSASFGDRFRRYNTQSGFTKQRVGGATAIKFNALDSLLNYVKNANGMIYLEPELKRVSSIVNNERYGKSVGTYIQNYYKDWLSLVAKNGITEEAIAYRQLNKLRGNISAGVMGFKLSTIIKQPLAKITSSGLLGKDAFVHDAEYFGNGLWEQVHNASKQMKLRGGDNPELIEGMNKFQQIGYAGLKWSDRITADSVWYGAYKKYFSDNKIKYSLKDFKDGQFDAEAVDYANKIVRKTQGTGQFKDLPRAMTGKGSAFTKIFMTFQSFALNQAYLIPQDAILKAAIKEKNYGKAIGIGMAITLSGLAEGGVNSGLNMVFGSEKTKEKEREKTIGDRLISGTLLNIPIISNIDGMVNYDSSGNPLFDTVGDVISGAKSAISGKSTETKQKGAVSAGAATGELLGIPGMAQLQQILKMGIGESTSSGTSGTTTKKTTKTKITNKTVKTKITKTKKQ